jgi:hypothetical protein
MRDGAEISRMLYTSNEGKQLNFRAFHDLLPQGVSGRCGLYRPIYSADHVNFVRPSSARWESILQ